jgi:hypothetical protein
MEAADPRRPPRRLAVRAEIVGLRAAMATAAINLWTGSPLLGLWVGARVATSTRPSMLAVLVVVVTILASSFALIWVLGRASAAHDRLTGQGRTVRRHVPWLRSARGERIEWERGRVGLTTLERILVVAVVAALLVFEIWFFVASPSPIEPGPAKD